MLGKPLMLSPFSTRRFGAARVDTIPLLNRTLHRPAVRRMSLPMSLESSLPQLAPPAIFRPLSKPFIFLRGRKGLWRSRSRGAGVELSRSRPETLRRSRVQHRRCARERRRRRLRTRGTSRVLLTFRTGPLHADSAVGMQLGTHRPVRSVRPTHHPTLPGGRPRTTAPDAAHPKRSRCAGRNVLRT